MVGGTCPFLLVFNGKIHLYYKAHPMGLGGQKTSIPDFSGGLALQIAHLVWLKNILLTLYLIVVMK